MPRLRFTSTVQGVSTIELNEPIITVGRVANNVVCIEDPNISKHHTLLVSEDDTYKIYDLHSVNGTWVNGERITVTRLKEGDAVRIGYLELKYEIAAPVVTAPVAAPRPTLVSPVASKTATGPTTLAARPRLGLKPPGTPVAPVVVPAVAAIPHAPVPVVQPLATPPPATTTPPPPPAPVLAPTKEETRTMIRLPEEKKPVAPAPPVPVPAASSPPPPPTPAPAPSLGGPPKLKTFARESAPPPPLRPAAKPEPGPEPVPVESATAAPAESAPPAPTTGPKKLGGAPGGGPPKFKLKRE